MLSAQGVDWSFCGHSDVSSCPNSLPVTILTTKFNGACCSVLVKALRYSRTVSGSIPGDVTLEIFSVATDGTMCPGVD
jgi:hypothetical protein